MSMRDCGQIPQIIQLNFPNYMNPPYVCQRCLRSVAFRAQHQFRYSSYVSAGRAGGQGDIVDAPPPNPKPKHVYGAKAGSGSREPDQSCTKRRTNVDRILESLFTSNQSSSQPTRSRYSRKPIDEPPSQEPDKTSLLERVDPQSLSSADPPSAQTPSVSIAQNSTKSPARTECIEQRLRTLLATLTALEQQLSNDKASLPEIWRACILILESDSWKACWRKPQLRSDEILSIFRRIIFAITKERSINVDGKNINSVEVISVFAAKGVMRDWWHEIIWIQLGNLIRSRRIEPSGNASQCGVRISLQDLLQTWMAYVQQNRMWHESEQQSTDKETLNDVIRYTSPQDGFRGNKAVQWDSLPSLPLEEVHQELPKHLITRFEYLFGIKFKHPVSKNLAPAGVLSLHYIEILRAEDPSISEMLDEARPFIQRLRLLAQEVRMDCVNFVHCLRRVDLPGDWIEAAKLEWLHSPIHLVRDSALFLTGGGRQENDQNFDWTKEEVDKFFAETNRLKEKADGSAATELWLKKKVQIRSQKPEDEGLRSKIFARFLKLFFSLRLSTTAVDVWNHMISVGHQPGLRHWNAMLSGCGHSRDLPSLHGVWSKMLEAKVKPDNETWTSYIHGVIRAGNTNQGLQLLEQLGRDWASTKVPLTPSLGPVHGALSAFLEVGWMRNSVTNMHQTILTWARSQGLRPTTQTYNILLQPIAKTATTEEIAAHLEAMSADMCQPDVYTYTIILQGPIHSDGNSHFYTLPESAQTAAITNVLSSMETHNIQPSPHTYSTLLYGLLDDRAHPPNTPAARAVLAHMEAAGIEPSQHIHTILLGHYFSTTPPDLAAIEVLVHKLMHKPRTRANLNTHFYNKLISGYANCDEWEKSLHYLRLLPGEGKSPGWTQVWRVLVALGRAEEWDLCAEVVDGVESGETLKWAGSGVEGSGWKDYVDEVEGLRAKGLIPEKRKGEVVKFSGWGLQRDRLGGFART